MTIVEQLKGFEGLRLTVYDDATGAPIVPGSHVVGHPTIGYGRCLDTHGISKDEAESLFNNDVVSHGLDLARALPWVRNLDEVRRAVLVEMTFQMGVAGVLEFRNALRHIQAGEFADAAKEMLASKWAEQTPNRAHRLSVQLETGTWQ